MKKNNTLLAAIFILFVNLSYGQRPKDIKNSEVKGIFLTHADFKQNKLICSSNNQNKAVKIKLNQFFISPEISCFELQKDSVFHKDSIFAIHCAKEIPVTYYYFSSGQNKEVYSLTVANLCKYLQIESDIKVAINQKYKSDEMLYSLNQKTGHFIINEFLIELTKNKQ